MISRREIDLPDDFETFKANLQSQRNYNHRWGRNHNVGFHMVFVLGTVVAILAIITDFYGIKGGSIIGLAGGAILAVPTAFKMKEKSLWYFEYARQMDAILNRLGARSLDHTEAVEEEIRLDGAMTDVWNSLTRSIDIKPIVEAIKTGGIATNARSMDDTSARRRSRSAKTRSAKTRSTETGATAAGTNPGQ
jgi:hypothetical protein